MTQQMDKTVSKYITFKLDEKQYAIDISHVLEIIGLHKVTKIPKTPKYIQGIINLRGEIVPIMDTRLKLKKEQREYNDSSSIIVVSREEMTIGMLVDRVAEVIEINREKIMLPPEFKDHAANQFISGIYDGDARHFILDIDRILLDKEHEVNLSQVMN